MSDYTKSELLSINTQVLAIRVLDSCAQLVTEYSSDAVSDHDMGKAVARLITEAILLRRCRRLIKGSLSGMGINWTLRATMLTYADAALSAYNHLRKWNGIQDHEKQIASIIARNYHMLETHDFNKVERIYWDE